ncbi:MAG: LuxR C-terminal-related transcriptional regulator [Nitrospirota bacterium]
MGTQIALRRKFQPRQSENNAELLTPRQRDILRLVSVGHTNREIAEVLEISVRTVEVHRFNLMRRLNVRNVAQLLRQSLQLGLLAKTFGAK